MEISTTYNSIEKVVIKLSVAEIEEAVNSYISKKVPVINKMNGKRSMEFILDFDFGDDSVVGIAWTKVREKDEKTVLGLPIDDEKTEVVP